MGLDTHCGNGTAKRFLVEVQNLIFAYTRLDLHHQGTGAKPDDAIPRGSQTLHVHAIQNLKSHA